MAYVCTCWYGQITQMYVCVCKCLRKERSWRMLCTPHCIVARTCVSKQSPSRVKLGRLFDNLYPSPPIHQWSSVSLHKIYHPVQIKEALANASCMSDAWGHGSKVDLSMVRNMVPWWQRLETCHRLDLRGTIALHWPVQKRLKLAHHSLCRERHQHASRSLCFCQTLLFTYYRGKHACADLCYLASIAQGIAGSTCKGHSNYNTSSQYIHLPRKIDVFVAFYDRVTAAF